MNSPISLASIIFRSNSMPQIDILWSPLDWRIGASWRRAVEPITHIPGGTNLYNTFIVHIHPIPCVAIQLAWSKIVDSQAQRVAMRAHVLTEEEAAFMEGLLGKKNGERM